MQEHSRYGLTLKQYKSGILSTPIQIYDNLCPLRIPVDYQAELLVEAGTVVERHQPLAKAGADGGNSVFAPFGGLVEGVFDLQHAFFGEIRVVALTPDEHTESIVRNTKKLPSRLKYILPAIRQAGIIDALDGRPLADKLEEFAQRKLSLLAVNAIEDQPYVCSSSALILQNTEDIFLGLELAARVVGAQKQEVYTYRSKSFNVLKPRLTNAPEIIYLTGKYPVETVFVNAHPETGFIGAQACLDLLAAVDTGTPQTMMIVTVAGDCVTNPCNIWVPVGMPAAQLLNYCGLREDPSVVVMGGSMTGQAILDLSMPLGLGVSALLALKTEPLPDITNCCGCGDCVRCCPERLMPVYISRFARHGKFDECETFGADRCIECGCCSYVCRGQINPSAFTAMAKHEILSRRVPKKGASDATD